MNPNDFGPVPDRPPARRRQLILILIAVVILVGGALTGVLLLTRSGQPDAGTPPAAPVQTSTSPSAGPSPTITPPSTHTPTPPTSPTSPTTQPGFAYQPLWPFATEADAAAWQQAYRTGGHQPWHLDAGLTALSFTQGYLGYADIDTVLGVTMSGNAAWVTVGLANPRSRRAGRTRRGRPRWRSPRPGAAC